MWNSLIDGLNPDHWKEIPVAEKKQAEYMEVHMGRAHQRVSPTVMHYQVAPEEGEMTIAEVSDILPDQDPLKDIGLVEFKFNADKTVVLGIDLNGDIVQRRRSRK